MATNFEQNNFIHIQELTEVYLTSIVFDLNNEKYPSETGAKCTVSTETGTKTFDLWSAGDKLDEDKDLTIINVDTTQSNLLSYDETNLTLTLPKGQLFNLIITDSYGDGWQGGVVKLNYKNGDKDDVYILDDFSSGGSKTFNLATKITPKKYTLLQDCFITDILSGYNGSTDMYFELGSNDIFDGGNFTIDYNNLNTSGIFSCSSTCTIQNLMIQNANINELGGGIIRQKQSNFTVENCSNTGTISGDGAGGIVGSQCNGTVENCSNTGTISGDGAGGIVGSECNVTVKNCFNDGNIHNTSYLDTGGTLFNNSSGGIAGSQSSGTITNCYNTGQIQSTGTVDGYMYGGSGGIVGSESSCIITNCYNTGEINGDGAGGIAGHSFNGTITNCYNTGNSNNNRAGGIAGHKCYSAITICYNTGTIGFNGGGIVGSNCSGSIINCYNTGTIGFNGGGIVGSNCSGAITNCYNTWTTINGDGAGGIAGPNFGSNITKCYTNGDFTVGNRGNIVAGGNINLIENLENESVLTDKFTLFDNNYIIDSFNIASPTYPMLRGIYENFKGYTQYNSVNLTFKTPEPLITISGENPVTIEVGTSYNDAGATATDNEDRDITADIVTTNNVNTDVVGRYTITYNVSDEAGNAATEVIRTVNVINKPTITIQGDNPVTIEVGTSYTDAGATAKDYYEKELTVIPTSTVYTSGVGIYTITYNVTDEYGIDALEATRTVRVINKPTITIIGDNPVKIGLGETYTDAGATAKDYYNIDISISNIIIDDTDLDINTVGNYEIKYNVTDDYGIDAEEATRIVNVVDMTPRIALNGSSTITLFQYSNYVELGAKAYSYDDKYLGVVIDIDSSTIDTVTVNSYTATYSYTDADGRSVTTSRTVNVVDLIEPTITLNGSPTVLVDVGSTYTDAGVNLSGDGLDMASNLETENPVDTSKVGTYYVTYTYTSTQGIDFKKIRAVIVKESDSVITSEDQSLYADSVTSVAFIEDLKNNSELLKAVSERQIGDSSISVKNAAEAVLAERGNYVLVRLNTSAENASYDAVAESANNILDSLTDSLQSVYESVGASSVTVTIPDGIKTQFFNSKETKALTKTTSAEAKTKAKKLFADLLNSSKFTCAVPIINAGGESVIETPSVGVKATRVEIPPSSQTYNYLDNNHRFSLNTDALGKLTIIYQVKDMTGSWVNTNLDFNFGSFVSSIILDKEDVTLYEINVDGKIYSGMIENNTITIYSSVEEAATATGMLTSEFLDSVKMVSININIK